MHTEQEQVNSFKDVECVVADTLRFKRKLAIGEDAYTSMRVGKGLAQLWDVYGMAATGGQLAASATVARTFFASGSMLSTVGIGAVAVTPTVWVLGAALVTAGAYYGVTRLFKSYSGSRVEVIPKFINTPIDLLGASLMDLLGALSFKVAHMDGAVTDPEKEAILEYFIAEWGYDRDYASSALTVIEENSTAASLKVMTTAFTTFARANPDCNFDAMCGELVGFLREVAIADGKLDEREELAIEKIDQMIREASSLTSSVASMATIPVQAKGWVSKLTTMMRIRRKTEEPPVSK